ncbi:sigma-70 family RNA polymerase sigma factor [Magnetospirillum sp. 15-1]|uniref:sigma-70 family RNA polymerase sigma factor n=1 Tax=Magnetospirillum sp. 15-1 TaxID=1979370 RepID=UPI0018D5211C|nr:sigma-70 family RNA polymerase sigma factor [Magnetospirillum sp. 15-1]
MRADDTHLRDLMRAAQGGDGRAYGSLLTEAAPIIRRAVARRWRGPDTEDIVQEVLLSVHAVRHTYDAARPFLPWLLAIVHYRVADAARRHARRAAREAPECGFEHGLPDVAAPTAEEGPGDPQLLARALADLPEGQRRAIHLLKLEERSLKEAAAATGMSVGALKVAVHRGIKALRRKLAGGEGEE